MVKLVDGFDVGDFTKNAGEINILKYGDGLNEVSDEYTP